MSKWIKIDKQTDLPIGDWIVLLKEEIYGLKQHTASKCKVQGGYLTIIGGQFDFDMPDITHYAPLLEVPR